MTILLIQVNDTEIQRVKSYIISWRLRVGFQVHGQVIAPNLFRDLPFFFQIKMLVTICVKN